MDTLRTLRSASVLSWAIILTALGLLIWNSVRPYPQPPAPVVQVHVNPPALVAQVHVNLPPPVVQVHVTSLVPAVKVPVVQVHVTQAPAGTACNTSDASSSQDNRSYRREGS